MKNLKFFLLIISITVNAQKGNGIALQQLRPTQPNYNYNYSYNLFRLFFNFLSHIRYIY